MRLLTLDEPLENAAEFTSERFIFNAINILHRVDLSDLGQPNFVAFWTLGVWVSSRNLSGVSEINVKLYENEVRYVLGTRLRRFTPPGSWRH